MSRIGDNGGPLIDDESAAKIRYIKVNVAELLEGIAELTFEQRGYYLTALFSMYARMGGLPFDEREGAKIMRCDIRLYRRMRDTLIASGKLYADGDMIYNVRVEREIADYVREHKRRREAAIERESRKRAGADFSRTSPELLGDFSRTSPRSSKEVSKKSSGLKAKKSTKSNDALPQPYHETTTNHKPLTINHKPIDKDSPPVVPQGTRTREAGPNEQEVSHGVIINCETVRHKNGYFAISIPSIELATQGTVPRERVEAIVKGYALQWGLEIEAGGDPKRVVPNDALAYVTAQVRKEFRRPIEDEFKRTRAVTESQRQKTQLAETWTKVLEDELAKAEGSSRG